MERATVEHLLNGSDEATSKELIHHRTLNVSQWKGQYQLKSMAYKSTLPDVTPMLTHEQNHAPIQWTIQHKRHHCTRTTFIDQSCFSHTIGRWSRNSSIEVKRIEDCGISINGLIP